VREDAKAVTPEKEIPPAEAPTTVEHDETAITCGEGKTVDDEETDVEQKEKKTEAVVVSESATVTTAVEDTSMSLLSPCKLNKSDQLISLLNQSNVSSSTLNQTNQPATAKPSSHNLGNGQNPNVSLINAADSFNVSSSGYNGSSSCAGSNTINLSLDSVVDRFADE
jgi:hypothetical protein